MLRTLTHSTWVVERSSSLLTIERKKGPPISTETYAPKSSKEAKENTQRRKVVCCKATTLRNSSSAPMWGDDGNAVGEHSVSVVSTCLPAFATDAWSEGPISFDQASPTCDCHEWNRPGFSLWWTSCTSSEPLRWVRPVLAFQRSSIDDSSIARTANRRSQ